tara:strand:- start:52 stop:396 length:345 start_codon:yes stop_codon:yes gene_type:complete
MATISKQFLAGANGTGIKIVQTTSAGTLIHTAIAGATDIDEIWIWACNTDTSALTLTLEWGSADVDDNIKMVIQPSETVLVVPGLILQNGLTVRGFCATANKINCFGYANRLDV